MIILACETSTLLGSVAVLENNQVLAIEDSMRKGSHSEILNLFIETALAKANKKLSDVDVFATGIGPGSFTGIRISLNTIKTLAYCFNKPVISMNSLFNLALEVSSQLEVKNLQNTGLEFKNKPIISMINAYKNMVYVATYGSTNGALIELKKPEVVRVQNLAAYITEESVICGDGFTTYEKYFSTQVLQKMIRINTISDEPHAKNIGLINTHDLKIQNWNELVPMYLRASEAEENLLGIKYQPLV